MQLSLIKIIIVYFFIAINICDARAERINTKLSSQSNTVLQVKNFNFDIQSIVQLKDRIVIAGQHGFLAYSDNNGKSWLRSNTKTSTNIQSVAHNVKQLILVAKQGAIRRSVDNAGSWQVIYSPIIDDLNSVAHIHGDKFIAVGNKGTVITSLDGGISWKASPKSTTADLLKIAFITAKHGFAVGKKGTILESKDGGNSWHSISIVNGANIHLKDIAFYDANHGLIIGDKILKTIDGGNTWHLIDNPHRGSVKKAIYLDKSNVIAIGGSILHSYDGGQTWPDVFRPPKQLQDALYQHNGRLFLVGQDGVMLEKNLNTNLPWQIRHGKRINPKKIALVNNNVILVKNSYEVYKSVDSGQTWKTVFKCHKDLRDIAFRTPEFGVLVCNDAIYYTHNEGLTWHKGIKHPKHSVYKIYLPENNSIIVLGYQGNLSLSNNNGASWTKANTGTDNNLAAVMFLNKKSVVATGTYGTFIKSTDGGYHWKRISHRIKDHKHIFGLTSHGKRLVALSSEGSIIMSNDSGNSWAFLSKNPGYTNTIILSDQSHMLLLGTREIFYSDTGGIKWYKVNVEPWIEGHYADSEHILIVNYKGDFLKSVDKGKTWRNLAFDFMPIGTPFEIGNKPF